jgi:hypothetical protein
VAGLSADEVLDGLDGFVEELAELGELAALGVLERVQDDLDADLGLLLGVLGLGLLVLLRLLGGLALLRGDLLGLGLLGGVLHRLGGLGVGLGHLVAHLLHLLGGLVHLVGKVLLLLGVLVELLLLFGGQVLRLLAEGLLRDVLQLVSQFVLLVEDLLDVVDHLGEIADLVHLLHRALEAPG